MVILDIALNRDGDISFSGSGDLQKFSDLEAVRQFIGLCLTVPQGTLRYSRGFGSRLYELIGGVNRIKIEREALAKLYVSAALKNNPYVASINDVSVHDHGSYDGRLTIDVSLTVYLDAARIQKANTTITIGNYF